MDNKLEFMARKNDWSFGISLYARIDVPEGECVAMPMAFEQRESGLVSEPFAQISIESAQQLMDELWQCGLRPSEGTGSAGSLAATEKHLRDMRTIVDKMLKVKL